MKRFKIILGVIIISILVAGSANAYFSEYWKTVRDLVSRTTAGIDLNGNELIWDEDGDTQMRAYSDDIISFDIGDVGTGEYLFSGTELDLNDNNLTTTGNVIAPQFRMTLGGTEKWKFIVNVFSDLTWVDMTMPMGGELVFTVEEGDAGSIYFPQTDRKVGIGTNAPSEMLDVVGNITASGILTADTLTDGTLTITGGDLTTTGIIECAYSTIGDNNIVAQFESGFWGAYLVDTNEGFGAKFWDATNTVYLADGVYAYNDGNLTIDASGNLVTTGELDIGGTGSGQIYYTDGTTYGELGNNTHAAYFYSGDGYEVNIGYSGTHALGAVDGTNIVTLCDGSYAIDLTGDSLFTGDFTVTGTLGAGATTVTSLDAGAGAITTTGTISTPELFNTAGDLKIMPDIQGDVVFFGDTDVATAGTDGKSVKVYRRAAEGDAYYNFYVDQYKQGRFAMVGGDFKISTNVGAIEIESSAGKDIFFDPGGDLGIIFSEAAGVRQLELKDSGFNIVSTIDSDGNGYFAGTVDVTGTSTLGAGANYIQIDSDGVLTLHGTAKRDLTLRADLDYTNITAQGKPTQVNVGVFHGYSMPIYNNDDEELFFNENVPGRWDGASDITFHVLVALALAETADETFKFQLSWNQAGETDVVPATTHDVTDEITVVDGTQYATYMLEFTIDYNADAGDAIVTHDDLAGRLRRVASTGDEVDGEVIVLDWHTHYTVDKMFKAPE